MVTGKDVQNGPDGRADRRLRDKLMGQFVNNDSHSRPCNPAYSEGYCATFGHRLGCGHEVTFEGPEPKCSTPDCEGHFVDADGFRWCKVP
jgi:hypothetical protein